ncbi:hypothetical protein E1180_21325 [Roseibium denhamense]|uniref:Sel1 repeat-containing protein n=1 Tax=Roseibium denhamense TaxID=76305 RepID=A0ABY1NSG7_9HYPH|nr:caspase family protein [Roseibium denhamense]MTI08046.1 hypothetical protein [Roseibium denhamense]SMP15905.1 Sel1 repeat-containing protein [Roseibium denhamense]
MKNAYSSPERSPGRNPVTGIKYKPRMPALKTAIFSLPLVFMIGHGAAEASVENGRRVALVIGNEAYRYVEPLENPLNDTAAITKTLRDADFDVTIGTDLTKKELELVVRKFLRELNDGDTALFYYSGHALQVGDSNFLLPVDAKLASQYDLEFESLKVSHLLDYMKAASSLQIVMLDACRDNPFEIASLYWGEEEYSLGKTRGLRRIPNKLGAFISYATRPGEVAYDGAGPMSPFTTSVVANALNPALEIKDLMTRVREDVVEKTGGRQIPYEDSTLVTDFYFVPPKPAPVVTAHHRIGILASDSATPLGIPEPVQPEGGDVTALITLAPERGKLVLIDGTEVTEGVQVAAADLAGLAYVPGSAGGAGVELIGYEVTDTWGGTASAIASVTISEADTPSDEPVPAPQESGPALLAELKTWLKDTVQTGAKAAPVGVGPIPLYAEAPVQGVGPSASWLKVVSVDPQLQLASDDRLLQAGDRLPASALNSLTVRPQIGSNDSVRQFELEIPETADAPAMTVAQRVRPEVTACDDLAAQPFDLQAVAEGRLANELDAPAVITACSEAMETYPEVGRFVFQRGRGSFAAGDLAQAAKDFERAYQMGHVRAGQVLGRMHYLGAGIDRDQERAVSLYEQAAERGDAYALHSLGLAQIKGEGTVQDEQAGLEKLLQAVEAGHTFAFNAIGGFYLRGQHVDEDISRAVYYFNRSAARDDVYGYLNLGTLYRDGKGVPEDMAAALGWFKKAHEGGHPAAGTAIGLMYFNGQGVEKSEAEATRWFRESAERGDPWGAFNTAFMLGRQSGDAAAQERVKMLALAVAVDPASSAAQKATDGLASADRRAKARALQQTLTDLGFDPGPVDGQPGRKTRAALAAFFEASGRSAVTGDPALVELVKYEWEQDRPRYDLF